MGSDKIADLIKSVRNLEPSVTILFTNLLEYHINEWKERVIELRGEDRIEMIGAIKQVRSVLQGIKRSNAVKRKEEYRDGAYTGE